MSATLAYILKLVILIPLVAGLAWGSLWLWRRAQQGIGGAGRRERLVTLLDATQLGAAAKLAVVEFEQLRSWLAVLARSPHELVDHYRRLCSTLGQAVRVDLPDGRALTGTAEDVDAYGRLVVDGTAVAAGDVVHVRPAAEA